MKRVLKFLLMSIIFLFSINSVSAIEIENISSKNIILYNMNDDSILYEQNSEDKTLIASMTKIMTVIVALENIDNLDEKIILDYKVFRGLTSDLSMAKFRVNQTVTYRDLIYGALLPSGADATHALALFISGSEEEYVKLMNEKAQSLGLKNTHYTNTIGLESIDNMHYSTVKDVATLLKYCLKNEEFKKAFTSNTYLISDKTITLESTKKKIGEKFEIDLSFIEGSKTGYTSRAGLCLASIASYNGVDYMLITAGADYKDKKVNHFIDAKNIYSYFFENYEYKQILKKDDIIKEIKTKYDEKIKLKASNDVTRYLKKNIKKEDLEYIYTGKKILTKNIKKNDKIGKYIIKFNNEVLYEEDVLSPIDVEFKLKEEYKILLAILLTTIVFIKLFTMKLKKIKG